MNLKFVMRMTYLFAWVFAILALIYRGLAYAGVIYVTLPASSRGVLFFSAFLFMATIATGVYAQVYGATDGKSKGPSA
jgi:hypothetical protein